MRATGGGASLSSVRLAAISITTAGRATLFGVATFKWISFDPYPRIRTDLQETAFARDEADYPHLTKGGPAGFYEDHAA